MLASLQRQNFFLGHWSSVLGGKALRGECQQVCPEPPRSSNLTEIAGSSPHQMWKPTRNFG